ncbi:MAG: Ig-like domain-containing protein, partial [Chitinophagaceae bacterium]|nr:Ig-like domain-containing protein [Chitinophagaceae bacterium]
MTTKPTLLQMGRNAIGRLLSAPPSGSLLRKAATLLCAALAVNTAAEAQSTTFNYTGSSQTYTATSTGTLVIDMAGAKGGAKFSTGSYAPYTSDGGNGGRVVCSLAVTAGQVLNIYVGGVGQSPTSFLTSAAGGYNGGGNSGSCDGCGGWQHTGGGGGGATDIRIGGTTLSDRVLVAGGGGGSGYGGSSTLNSRKGGDGGGLTGGTGISGGTGGGQSSAGPGGSLGNGANGAGVQLSGGGGGGYYGGGVSGALNGGGGGSSFTHATLCTGVTHTQGYRAGNGYVIITPATPACSTPAAIGGPSSVCVGSTITLTNDTTGGTWSSASTSIASVNTSGVVTGNAAGTTTISYSKGTGCTVTKTITVNPLPTNVIGSFTPQPSIAGLPITFTVS